MNDNRKLAILGFGVIVAAALAMNLPTPQNPSPIPYDWKTGRTQGHYVIAPNDPVTGTIIYRMASPVDIGGVLHVTLTVAGQKNAFGVCVAQCGTSGNAIILLIGQTYCEFDAPVQANHFIQNSVTEAGKCSDVGIVRPSNGKIIGRTSQSGEGIVKVTLFGIGVQGGMQALRASVVHDFPSLGGGLCSDLAIPLAGAVAGDPVVISHPTSGTRGLFDQWVSASDEVTIRHCSVNGANDPPSATYNIWVVK